MKRALYSASITTFCESSVEEIIGTLAQSHQFSIEPAQRDAWKEQVSILQPLLRDFDGSIYFEFSIPRMGRRVDVVLVIEAVVFVLEFKVGEKKFPLHAIDQVWDYALDLKHFHESSRDVVIVPILVATEAKPPDICVAPTPHDDKLLAPIRSSSSTLGSVIRSVLSFCSDTPINAREWEAGRYCPTPTIIEAAVALYAGHSVADISRNEASADDPNAINLTKTSSTIFDIINSSKKNNQKAICFVTGVPGAGKTLVGLNVATAHFDASSDLYSVFLSGNQPLVDVLREALARNQIEVHKKNGKKLRKGDARNKVKAFIQNVHHFRDECLLHDTRPPAEHVVLFDEAQRAWNRSQTASFMKRKKGKADFQMSEPEFLISCMDRHPNWAVVVCLVGGGQELNTGEAGIGEWIEAVKRLFPEWHVYVSNRLTDSEYSAGRVLEDLSTHRNVTTHTELHLAVSMRSFRAEHVSLLVKHLLDLQPADARHILNSIVAKYPIVITRDLSRAKRWLKDKARGSERYGIVVSSQAERLRPHAIHVKSPMKPTNWFLNPKEDIRSSYYLEDVATEFHVQGLELDWTCVVWDADLRFRDSGWQHFSFAGSKWQGIQKPERQMYLKNAYRVLLTRARQGMAIVVPPGDPEDPTRDPKFYNPTFQYLQEIGIPVL